MTNNELNKRLTDTLEVLGVLGIGRGRFLKLVRAFGSATEIMSASQRELETVPGISHDLAVALVTKRDRDVAQQLAARVVQLGWKVLFLDDDDYPNPLKNVPSPPPLLFQTGCGLDPNAKMIAMVGTRRPTENGRSFARNLARTLAESGITVVSGMAEGIDSAAHRGALEGNGRTIAVWGSSLDIAYPPSNRGLAQEIQNQGAVLSEYLPGTHPDRAFFPQRNRIIAGLCEGTVVIEAGRKSGALITASHALEQGRELFAMPGSPTARMSEGTNQLIKNGAKLITSAEDVFEELPTMMGHVKAQEFLRQPDMTESEQVLIGHFAAEPLQIDHLSRMTSLPTTELMELLLALELKGVVREVPGKRYILSDNIV